MLSSARFVLVVSVATLFAVALVLRIYNYDAFPHFKTEASVESAERKPLLELLRQPPPEKGVVTAHLPGQDVSWLDNLTDWRPYVYVANDTTASLHPPVNKGQESISYLTFLIDFYDALPDTTAFIHYHETAWHNDDPLDTKSSLVSLQHLRTDTVQKRGYVNLRCTTMLSCPDMIRTDRPTTDPEYDSPDHQVEKFVPAAWEHIQILGQGVEVPKKIASACCAQFAVSREQVRKRQKSYYENIRRWVMETEESDWVSGRVMEYMWHMMFGREPVDCEDEKQCWCEVYGRCDG